MSTNVASFETIIAIQTLIATQETARWNYWMMVSGWFAAASTLLAVITSLYLANRRPKPKIDIIIYTGYSPVGPGLYHPGVMIDVANVGVASFVITGVDWVFNGTSHIAYDLSRGGGLPRKIDSGESNVFFIPVNDINLWLRNLKTIILASDGDFRKLKINVTLASRKTKSVKVPDKWIEILGSIKELGD